MAPEDRELPPSQMPIKRLMRWGTDHPAITSKIPKIDLKTWTLTIEGEVEKTLKLTWDEIVKLPSTESVSDFHCVEGWSVLDCKWQGIGFRAILDLVKPKQSAKSVTFECADGYTTSLMLRELSNDNVLLAYKLNSEQLEEGYGFPLRLVVPDKYAYKSALWLTRMKFTARKELGYWEKKGYNDTADVWKNDRFTK